MPKDGPVPQEQSALINPNDHSRFGLKIAILSRQLDEALAKQKKLVEALRDSNERLRQYHAMFCDPTADLRRIQRNNTLLFEAEWEEQRQALSKP